MGGLEVRLWLGRRDGFVRHRMGGLEDVRR